METRNEIHFLCKTNLSYLALADLVFFNKGNNQISRCNGVKSIKNR